jgi:hypothetical protein
MSKIQFQIGRDPHIRINLPSKGPGNSSVYMGRAVLKASRVSFSQDVKFTSSDLKSFLKDAKSVYQKLKGSFKLESHDSTFILRGVPTRKGMIQLEVLAKSTVFAQPDNVDWSAGASFVCYPDDLQGAISALEKEEEG